MSCSLALRMVSFGKSKLIPGAADQRTHVVAIRLNVPPHRHRRLTTTVSMRLQKGMSPASAYAAFASAVNPVSLPPMSDCLPASVQMI